jgi:Flp pilus assembly pilin Flp
MNHRLTRAFHAWVYREEGQTVVEYALILLLITTVAAAVLGAIGAFPSSVFSSINAGF